MTFEEALLRKKEIGEYELWENKKYWIWVVPSNNNDFNSYLRHYIHNEKTDEMAKLFCQDGNFSVVSIWSDSVSTFIRNIYTP